MPTSLNSTGKSYADRNIPADYDVRRLEVLDPMVIEIMRRKSSVEKLQIAYQLNRFARVAIREQIKAAHPEWTETQIDRELAQRMLRGST
jgi:hypothetical protein